MNNVLRSSSEFQEIVTILQQMMEEGAHCTIWQNIDDRKLHTECFIERIDFDLGTLVLKPLDQTFASNFQKRMQIYFKGSVQSILFKELAHYTSKKLLVINLPREIKLLEKRKAPRISLIDRENKVAEASKYDKESLEPRYFDLELLDISQGGLSFFLTSQQAGSIMTGDSLFFSRLLNVPLPTPIEATVKYTCPTKIKMKLVSERGTKVGVAFSNPLDQGLWKNLSL